MSTPKWRGTQPSSVDAGIALAPLQRFAPNPAILEMTGRQSLKKTYHVLAMPLSVPDDQFGALLAKTCTATILRQ